MTDRLHGKVALVTGAARGQGEAEARRFVAEGARVVLGDVLDDAGAAVASELGDSAWYQHLDVTSEDDWSAAVDTAASRFGGLHMLVSNAPKGDKFKLTPPTSATEHSPPRSAWQARCVATSEDAQAPSIATDGPRSPSAYEIRPAAKL